MNLVSRKEARSTGLKYYYTGKPCKRGHIAERFTRSRICRACDKQYAELNPHKKKATNRRWRHNNPDKVKAFKQKERRRHADKIRTRTRAWRALHINEIKIANRLWRHNNRSAATALKARRRARKLRATPIWTCKETVADFYLEAQYQGMHVDHIVPLKHPLVCGLHVEHNLQLLTAAENQRKYNRFTP